MQNTTSVVVTAQAATYRSDVSNCAITADTFSPNPEPKTKLNLTPTTSKEAHMGRHASIFLDAPPYTCVMLYTQSSDSIKALILLPSVKQAPPPKPRPLSAKLQPPTPDAGRKEKDLAISGYGPFSGRCSGGFRLNLWNL